MTLKRILMAAMVLASATAAFGQYTTTYVGTIRDLTGAIVTSGRITWQLNAPSGGSIPGVGSFVASTVSCLIDGTGKPVAGDGVSPCVIANNSALTPTGTSYTMCRQPYNVTPGSCFVTFANGGTVDISQIIPTPATMPNYGFPAGGPTGPVGPANALSIGEVATGTPGSPAAATITGSSPAQVLNLTIPTGLTGAKGPPTTFLNTWSSSTTYATGDAVSYFTSGCTSSYVALTPNINVIPTTTSTWGLQAACGSGSGLSGTTGQAAVFNSPSTATSVDPSLGASVSPMAGVASVYDTPGIDIAMPTSGVSGIDNLGDSITANVGATGGTGTPPYLSTSYTGIIASALGQTAVTLGGNWHNYGVGGDQACDQARQAFGNVNPTVGDGIVRTIMIGLNDADVKQSGSYDFVYNLCHRAMLTWLTIPSSQKTMGSAATPATGWSIDTTFAAAHGLTTTTTNLPQTWTFTNTSSGVEPEVYIWYVINDPGGAVVPGQFKWSLDGGTVHYVNTATNPTISTQNGATQSIGVVDIGFPAGIPALHTVTTTMTSATSTSVTILGVGFGPDANTMPVWVAGVSRNIFDCAGADTRHYNDLAEANVSALRKLGFLNLHFVNVRAYWRGDVADMSSTASCQHHPNNAGHAEIAAAFLGTTAQPQSQKPADLTQPPFRQIGSLTNCVLSPTDGSVNFFSGSAGNCGLPTDSDVIPGKILYLQNTGAGAVTITATMGQSGTAVGQVLLQHQGMTIQNVIGQQWNMLGLGITNIMQHSCKISPTLPYTILVTDDCLVFTAAGAITFPVMTVGQSFLIINNSTGDLTFTNGLIVTQNLHPGASLIGTAISTGAVRAVYGGVGGYTNPVKITASTYTIGQYDDLLWTTATGTVTITLPTTLATGKTIPVWNEGTGNIVFTGATSGNANAAAIAPGQVGWISAQPSGAWYATVTGMYRATTASIGGSALAAGACASGTVAVANSTTGQVVDVSPATYPGDGIYYEGYVSAAGTVTIKVCAVAALTPTASTYNVSVTP